jgi:hypothetical protein
LSAVDASAYSPQALPPTSPSVGGVVPDENATAVDPSSYSPQASPPHETTTPLPAVLPSFDVATLIDPPILLPQETIPLPVTPLPSVARAAASNDEKIAPPLGGAEPEMTNSKLDIGVDQAEGYVCRRLVPSAQDFAPITCRSGTLCSC